jgi:hypothetical protein
MQVCSTVICFLQVVCDRAHSAERLQQLSAIASGLLCRDAVRQSKPVHCDLSCRQLLCHGYRIAVALSGRNVVRTPKSLCVARSPCSNQASLFNLFLKARPSCCFVSPGRAQLDSLRRAIAPVVRTNCRATMPSRLPPPARVSAAQSARLALRAQATRH